MHLPIPRLKPMISPSPPTAHSTDAQAPEHPPPTAVPRNPLRTRHLLRPMRLTCREEGLSDYMLDVKVGRDETYCDQQLCPMDERLVYGTTSVLRSKSFEGVVLFCKGKGKCLRSCSRPTAFAFEEEEVYAVVSVATRSCTRAIGRMDTGDY